jgi:hypothetical protein
MFYEPALGRRRLQKTCLPKAKCLERVRVKKKKARKTSFPDNLTGKIAETLVANHLLLYSEEPI